jgi:hypothetical protein
VWDKPIYVNFAGGCCDTKRRIDLRILIEHEHKGIFWLAVEIDENQHKAYAADYETSRYDDLFMDFSGRYVFLRINPDAFMCNGERVNPSFDERAPTVIANIADLIREGPVGKELVKVRHLFYNN